MNRSFFCGSDARTRSPALTGHRRFATDSIDERSHPSAITSRMSTPMSVTPGGVGLLRTILAAFSASDFVLTTTQDKQLPPSRAAAQYPLTKPGALLTWGTTFSCSALREASN